MKLTVLVLDDEQEKRQDLSKFLRKEGYEVYTSENIEQANKIIQLESIDFAIVDLKIDYSSDYGGIKVIENINKLQPRAKTIVLSAYDKNAEIENQLENVIYDGYISKGWDQNYILAVATELHRLRAMPPKRKCFVIMPFSSTKSCSQEQWTDIFENMIKPAVEDSGYQYECFRANLVIGNIIRDILDTLNRADVVIADLTDQNPNVFYELGVRHALRNATILIAQHIDHIPFDLRHYAALIYNWTTKKGKDEFKEKIKRVLSEIEDSPDHPNTMSPIREYLKI